MNATLPCSVTGAELRHDEEHVDISEFQRQGLESVVATIQLYGVYPRPTGKQPARFVLSEFIANEIDSSELAEFMVAALTYHSDFAEARSKWERCIEVKLTEHFRGSDIVREKAEEFADLDAQDAIGAKVMA